MSAKKNKKPIKNSAKKPLNKKVTKLEKKPLKKVEKKTILNKKPSPKNNQKSDKSKIKKSPTKNLKPAKKTTKISVKTLKKPTVKKAATKKTKGSIAKSSTPKSQKPSKKTNEKTTKKSLITSKAKPKDFKQPTNLAKSILAKTSEKKPAAPKAPEKIDFAPKVISVKKSESRSKVNFKVGDFAIYPSHGIGKIIDIEKTFILGQDFSCYLMHFEKERLTIKIPINSAEKIGLRHLASKEQMDEVFSILRSGVKKLKGMWSRRAQEYETKINSGDIILLAEVLRDLTRDIEDGERSYSERIIYETAISRLSNEYAAIYGVTFEEAKEKVVITAKDKLNSEGKVIQKDEFDDFDLDRERSIDSEDDDDENESDDEDDEDGDDDDGYDDDDYGYDDDEDDDKPKKKRKK